jgi:hypothetical protein
MTRAVRYGVPTLLVVGGIVAILVFGDLGPPAGATLIAGAAFIAAIGLLARLSLSSEHDREREAAARGEFERTGRWPDERAPRADRRDGGRVG